MNNEINNRVPRGQLKLFGYVHSIKHFLPLCFGNGSWPMMTSELCTQKVLVCPGQNLAGDHSTNLTVWTSKFWCLGPGTISFTGRAVAGVSEGSLLSPISLLAFAHLPNFWSQEDLMSLADTCLMRSCLGPRTYYSRSVHELIFGICATRR